jgi:hypothetical protein
VSELTTEKECYLAWYPSLEPTRDTVSTILTRGQCAKTPLGGTQFAACIAAAAGLKLSPTNFVCDEFVTRYFQGPDAVDGWEECWDLRLFFPEKLQEPSLKELVKFPIREMPETVGEYRVHIPVRVIADFNSKSAAEACRSQLRAKAREQAIHWSDRYAIRTVARQHVQLLIDVGMAERSQISKLFPAALQIMEICEQRGGRTSFATESKPSRGDVPNART